MANQDWLSNDDIRDMLSLSSDEEDLSDDDDMDVFVLDTSENMSSNSDGELSSYIESDEESETDDEEMDVNDDNSLIGAQNQAGSSVLVGGSANGAASISAWRPYDAADPDLLKIPFSVSNPGINIPPGIDHDDQLSFFQLFFTDEIINEFVQETNRYAQEKIQKNTPLRKHSVWNDWTDTSLDEMKAFLGVIVNMGMNSKCDMKEYFSRQWLDEMAFFTDMFSRKRFFQIFWMFHVQQSLNQGFRGDKVKNLVDHLNLKCREYLVPDENISIDESTIGFKGRVLWKCYNPNKPTKWGLRVYTMCDSATAYIMGFVPYYGKVTTDGLVRSDLPFTSRIVLELCNMLSSSVTGTGYHIFTDRFYTSPILCDELRKQSFHLTGTVMPNRKGMPDDISKKKRKPKLHEVVAFRQNDDTMMALQWKDKRIVTMLSSVYNIQCEDVQTKAAQSSTISKPVVISQYTKYMGGVDRADHYCGSYAFLRKTTKWWRKMFFWLLEVGMVNSFLLFNMSRKQRGLKEMRHRKFRKSVVLGLIGNVRNKSLKRSHMHSRERLRGQHFVFKIPNGKLKDCAVCSDRKVQRRQTSYWCDTCARKPGLHPGECFKKFHTEKHYK